MTTTINVVFDPTAVSNTTPGMALQRGKGQRKKEIMKLKVTEVRVVLGTTRPVSFAEGVLDAEGFYAGKTGILFNDFAKGRRLPEVGETVNVEFRYDRRPYVVSRPLGWETEEYSVYQV